MNVTEVTSQGLNLGLILTSLALLIILFSVFDKFKTHLQKFVLAGPDGLEEYLLNIVEITQKLILKFSYLPRTNIEFRPSDFEPILARDSHIIKNKWRISVTLIVIYSIYSVFMIQLFAPVRLNETGYTVIANNPVIYENYASIFLLTLSNVLTDLVSLAFTLQHLSYARNHLTRGKLGQSFWMILRDLIYAGFFFLVSQIFSNMLYPISIVGGETFNWNLIFSSETAFKPYGFILPFSESNEVLFTIPGQLFLTGTAFLPTLIYIFAFVFGFLSYSMYSSLLFFLKKQKWSCWYEGPNAQIAKLLPIGERNRNLNKQVQCINHLVIGSVSLCFGFLFLVAVGASANMLSEILKAHFLQSSYSFLI